MQTDNIRYNILFITKWYPNKFDPQLGVFVRKHAKAVSNYCNVSVLYTCVDNAIGATYETSISKKHGFTEIIVYYKKNNTIAKPLINLYRYFKANSLGIKEVRKHLGEIDLIHVNVLNRPGVIALIKKVKGIPYIITEHWTGYVSGNYQQKNFLKKWLSKRIVKHARVITTVSNSLKENMIYCGLRNNYVVVPNIIENIELPSSSTNSKVKILTIADLLDSQKNISGVIKAIAFISKQHPDVEYHIIGDGPDNSILKKLSDALQLTNKFVFFHGRQTNEYVYQFLKQTDFVVVNSIFETFSVVAAEALANGKPVITTICGGPEEFITTDHGILIEKNNQSQLEEAIAKMLLSYKNFDPQKLHAYVTGKFNYQTIGKQFYDIYRKILSKVK